MLALASQYCFKSVLCNCNPNVKSRVQNRTNSSRLKPFQNWSGNKHCPKTFRRVMRVPFQLILLGLGIAATTLILEGAKRAMSGKHKRSPKQGDSPSAKEARLAQDADPASATCDSKPTDKEVAAAEAARARLDGDQAKAASV